MAYATRSSSPIRCCPALNLNVSPIRPSPNQKRQLPYDSPHLRQLFPKEAMHAEMHKGVVTDSPASSSDGWEIWPDQFEPADDDRIFAGILDAMEQDTSDFCDKFGPFSNFAGSLTDDLFRGEEIYDMATIADASRDEEESVSFVILPAETSNITMQIFDDESFDGSSVEISDDEYSDGSSVEISYDSAIGWSFGILPGEFLRGALVLNDESGIEPSIIILDDESSIVEVLYVSMAGDDDSDCDELNQAHLQHDPLNLDNVINALRNAGTIDEVDEYVEARQ